MDRKYLSYGNKINLYFDVFQLPFECWKVICSLPQIFFHFLFLRDSLRYMTIYLKKKAVKREIRHSH